VIHRYLVATLVTIGLVSATAVDAQECTVKECAQRAVEEAARARQALADAMREINRLNGEFTSVKDKMNKFGIRRYTVEKQLAINEEETIFRPLRKGERGFGLMKCGDGEVPIAGGFDSQSRSLSLTAMQWNANGLLFEFHNLGEDQTVLMPIRLQVNCMTL
jgi:hypothetical protein